MAENQSKYLELLSKSQEEKDQEAVQSLVEQKQLQLQADILATKQSLGRAQKERTAMLSSVNLDFGALVEVEDAIEGYKKGLGRLEGFQSELF